MPLNLNSDKLIVVCTPEQQPVNYVFSGATLIPSGGTSVYNVSGNTWIVYSNPTGLTTTVVGSGGTWAGNISGNTWVVYSPDWTADILGLTMSAQTNYECCTGLTATFDTYTGATEITLSGLTVAGIGLNLTVFNHTGNTSIHTPYSAITAAISAATSGLTSSWSGLTGLPMDNTDLAAIITGITADTHSNALCCTGNTADIQYISGVTDNYHNELTGLTSSFNSHTGDTTIHHTLSQLNGLYVNVTGDTMTGTLNINSGGLNVTGNSKFFGQIITPNASPYQAITGNVRIGDNAGISFLNGNDNVAIGTTALNLATSINGTIAIGSGAMNKMISGGNDNTAVGASALGALLNGNKNIAIGHFAGLYNTSANGLENLSNSILIGEKTRSAESNTNTIVIGYQTDSKGSNTTTIGNASTVGTYLYGKIYESGTTALGNIYSKTGHTHAQYLTGVTCAMISGCTTGLTSSFTSHTGDTVIHFSGHTFTQSGITVITQVGDNVNIYVPAPAALEWSGVTNKPAWITGDTAAVFATGHTHSTYATKLEVATYTGTTAPATYFPISGYSFVASGACEIATSGNEVTIYAPSGGTGGGVSEAVFTGYTGVTAPATYLAKIADISVVTGTSKTIGAGDLGKVLEFTATGATTLTLPTGLTVGTQFTAVNLGGQVITFTAGAGVTLYSKSSAVKLESLYAGASAYYRASGKWLLMGDLT